MNRDDVLDTARGLISNDRDAVYGPPSENFRRIADGWSIIMGTEVTLAQVALCMDWVKSARLIQSPEHLDSWIDKAGYSGIGGEISQGVE